MMIRAALSEVPLRRPPSACVGRIKAALFTTCGIEKPPEPLEDVVKWPPVAASDHTLVNFANGSNAAAKPPVKIGKWMPDVISSPIILPAAVLTIA